MRYSTPFRRPRGCGPQIALAILIAPAVFADPPSSGAVQLIRDPDFQNGFMLQRPEPGKRVECGVARGPGGIPAVWDLAQWTSKFHFDESTPVGRAAGGAFVLANPARRVVFGGDDGVLSLGVNTGPEYGDRLRQKGEPWVHLLVSQRFATHPRLGDLDSIRLRLDARLARFEELQPGQHPHTHAAHCMMFITVQNLDRKSPGHGDYLWFGIPIYDNRYREIRTYAAPDSAGSGKFIYTPAPVPPPAPNIHDGQWTTFDLDLLPAMREGFAVARGRGFLKHLDSADDYRLGGMNLGWEMPGTYDVEIQIRGLRLTAIPRPPETDIPNAMSE